MFITVKKTTILTFVLVFIIAATAIVAYAKAKPKELSGLCIAVDAGHGGMDGGAVGYDGTLEKDINLQVAKKLKKLLKSGGAKVIMTRTKDESIHDSSAKTVREQKRSDLLKRKTIASDQGTDIFISVHMNKFEQSQYRGAQIFYADNEDSRHLAGCIKERIVPVSEKSEEREIKPAYSTMYILNGTSRPAVIAECGFLSNPEEEQLLNDSDYQDKIANALYLGICDFVNRGKDTEEEETEG